MKKLTCVCGDTFTRHPAHEVPCPSCRAKVGSPCKRPSEHGCEPHKERRQLAWRENPCSCLKQWLEQRAVARRRFARAAASNPMLWESGERELVALGWAEAA